MTRLELGLTGDLGEMVFPDVLDVLMSGYDLLTRVQQEILGERADDVQWTLTGLRQGSAVTVLEARPTELVQADDLDRVAHASTQGTRSLTAGATVPPAYFDQAALESYRDMVLRLRRANVGDLVVRGPHDEAPAVVIGREEHELPEPVRRLDARYVTTGSVMGMVKAINLHGRREVTLWSDLDRARVVVTFPERLYSRLHDALRHRVEASGRTHRGREWPPDSVATRRYRGPIRHWQRVAHARVPRRLDERHDTWAPATGMAGAQSPCNGTWVTLGRENCGVRLGEPWV